MAGFNLDTNITDKEAEILLVKLAVHLSRDEPWECVKESRSPRCAAHCDCFDCKPLTPIEAAIRALATTASETLLTNVFKSQP